MNIVFLTNSKKDSKPYLDWLVEHDENIKVLERKLVIEDLDETKSNFIICHCYKYIIPEDFLNLLGVWAINLQYSFLPWNRGEAPLMFNLVEDFPVGVTIHKIDKGVNTGEILLQEAISLSPNDTVEVAETKLKNAMFEMFCSNWKYLINRRVVQIKQTAEGSAYNTSELKKLNLIIDKAGKKITIKKFRELYGELK